MFLAYPGFLILAICLGKKLASILAYYARKTVKTVFPCSLRSSGGLTKKPRLFKCLLSVVMEE